MQANVERLVHQLEDLRTLTDEQATHISKLEPQNQKMMSENTKLKQKIEEYEERIEDLEEDISAMKNVILDEGELGRGIMQKMGKNERDRLSHLGLHMQRSSVAQPRRATFIKQARTAMTQQVDESDILSQDLENKYMKVIENFVTGVVKTVGVEETNALIAIRKEYLRKNLTIEAIFKDHE